MAMLVWFGVVFVCQVVQINRLVQMLNTTDEEHRKKVPKDKQRYCAADLIFAVLWVALGAMLLLDLFYEIFTGSRLI